jgi:hypothetical protein
MASVSNEGDRVEGRGQPGANNNVCRVLADRKGRLKAWHRQRPAAKQQLLRVCPAPAARHPPSAA